TAQVLEQVVPLAEACRGQELLFDIDVDGTWVRERQAKITTELPPWGGVEVIAQLYYAGDLHFEIISHHPDDFEIAAFTKQSNCCCVRIVLHPHLQCIKVILS